MHPVDREHLNKRQLNSEKRLKSFQSVWITSNYRKCKFDPATPDDPYPLPRPGRGNSHCLYTQDDTTIKYSIIYHMDLRDKQVTRPNGTVDTVHVARNVKWKWLFTWSKEVTINPWFTQLVTPYGTFGILDHQLKRVHFPTREDPRLIGFFEFKVRGPLCRAGYMMSPFTGLIVTHDSIAHQIGTKLPPYKKMKIDVPTSCQDINWPFIKDIWRYCYTWDTVIKDEDKKYGKKKRRKFANFKEMWCFSMYAQFEEFWNSLMQAKDIKINSGDYVSKDTAIEPFKDWHGNFTNYLKIKDFPDPKMIDEIIVTDRWVNYTYGIDDLTTYTVRELHPELFRQH